MTQPFITFEHVTLKPDDHLLFEDINWTWNADQQWAIVGPTGSGKSILTKALCHQVPLLKGRIRYFFHNTGEGEAAFEYGEILMVSPKLHQELMFRYGGYHQARWESLQGTDVPLVSYFLSGKGIEHSTPYDETPLKIPEEIYLARREKATALLGIGHLLNRHIHQLSNGEARKTLIARALMQSPRLLILDDPFGGLDAESRDALGKAIEEIIASHRMKILLALPSPADVPNGINHLLHVSQRRIVMQQPFDREMHVDNNTVPASVQVSITLPKDMSTGHHSHDTVLPGPLAEMKGVSVSYDGVKVLSDINWRVDYGQRWAVLGPNGAGKSTLLSLIMADNPQAYSNEITLFGRRRGTGESIWEIKARIGWMAPELQLYYTQGFTCLEVVCSGFFDTIGLYRDCSGSRRSSAMEWLRRLDLEETADHPFMTLSLGEQRLCLLARALVKGPELLILDEPCQALDDRRRAHINALLDRLCAHTNQTMIYVTHRPGELPGSITHVLRLNRGCILDITPRTGVQCDSP